MSKHQNRSKIGKQSHEKKALHKDWRTWVAVALMLGAVGIYVLTLDDSAELNAVNQIQAPAATSSSNTN